MVSIPGSHGQLSSPTGKALRPLSPSRARRQELGARFSRPWQSPCPLELVGSRSSHKDLASWEKWREARLPSPTNPSTPAGFQRPEMGARPSRRRLLPPDPPLALDALPPELLVQVLSHVPPCALVTRCRSVCCAWRDVVDGPTVWLLQLARDRSAEGRALYVVAQRCPPNSEEEEFPLCARARYCLLAPLGRSLIFNSCGERECQGRGLTTGTGTRRGRAGLGVRGRGLRRGP